MPGVQLLSLRGPVCAGLLYTLFTEYVKGEQRPHFWDPNLSQERTSSDPHSCLVLWLQHVKRWPGMHGYLCLLYWEFWIQSITFYNTRILATYATICLCNDICHSLLAKVQASEKAPNVYQQKALAKVNRVSQWDSCRGALKSYCMGPRHFWWQPCPGLIESIIFFVLHCTIYIYSI